MYTHIQTAPPPHTHACAEEVKFKAKYIFKLINLGHKTILEI
jgi:hypothetical protein